MGFQEAVKSFISRYTDFKGRSARSEFWWVVLALFIINMLIGIVTALIGETLGGILSLVFTLGIIIPYIALAVRRFHDLDKSGWWFLTLLIPLVNLIVVLVFFTRKGTDGPNQYGPDPLGSDASVFN